MAEHSVVDVVDRFSRPSAVISKHDGEDRILARVVEILKQFCMDKAKEFVAAAGFWVAEQICVFDKHQGQASPGTVRKTSPNPACLPQIFRQDPSRYCIVTAAMAHPSPAGRDGCTGLMDIVPFIDTTSR